MSSAKAQEAINRFNGYSAKTVALAGAERFRECADVYREWFEWERNMNSATARSLETLAVTTGYCSIFRINDLPPNDQDMEIC